MIELTIPVDPEGFFAERAKRKTPKKLQALGAGVVSVTASTPKNSGKGNAYRNTKTGFRPDIDTLCRSGWEANVMRILKSYNIPFEFEPNVFYFPIKRGTRAYTPDILLTATGEWIEVKGYFDDRSRIKLKRFCKYFPEEAAKLIMVINKSSRRSREICIELGLPFMFYEDLSKLYSKKVSNWEGR